MMHLPLVRDPHVRDKVKRSVVGPAILLLGVMSIPACSEEVAALIEQFATGHNGLSRQAYTRMVDIGKLAIPHLSKAIDDRRRNVRWLSVEALGAIGGEEVLPPLLISLKDEDKDVRRCSAWFLGKWGHGNEHVIPALRKTLHDSNSEVVWHVMESLDRLGDTMYKRDYQLVDSLCTRLEDHDEDRREHTAMALGMIGSSRACRSLVDALESSERDTDAIVDALGKIGSSHAVRPLLALFTNDANSKKVRGSAARVLQTLSDPSINDAVLPFTQSPEPWLRRLAVRALGFKDNVGAVPRLMAIVEDDVEERHVREIAVVSLGKIQDAQAVETIAQLLLGDDVHFAQEAAQALGEIGSPRAVPALIKALSDSRPFVVMNSARSLAEIGDKKAARPIFQLFNRKDAIKGTMSSHALFANIATVAHHALVKIVGEDPGFDKHLYVSTKEKLKETREMWRIKLGIPN